MTTEFKSGDLLRRASDKKRGIYLKDDGDSGRIFVQTAERVVCEPKADWTMMREGWGKTLKDEKSRVAALAGT